MCILRLDAYFCRKASLEAGADILETLTASFTQKLGVFQCGQKLAKTQQRSGASQTLDSARLKNPIKNFVCRDQWI